VSSVVKLLLFFVLAFSAQAEWRVAEPGWQYEFPRDHGNHPGFKTEWWYFTGNLVSADGREFGYQLTFFRQGIALDADIIPLSRFVTRDIKFAHFTLTDLVSKKFHFFQKLSRGAYGEAGFADRVVEPMGTHTAQSEDRDAEGQHPPTSVPAGSPVVDLAWIDDWTCQLTGANAFHLRAAKDNVAIDLRLTSAKPPVIHGTDGISQKAEGEGRASHYYSLTRLASEGIVRVGDTEFPVTGQSWFDHEWATNQLAENQAGWDWFSLQFGDGSELMLFQLRDKTGARDPFSSGTFVDAAGKSTPIAAADFSLAPGERWKSTQTGGIYPIAWHLAIPKLRLSLDLRAALDDQELRLKPIVYWEGAIRAQGSRSGKPLTATGYLEMTGYAGPITGMQAGK
jgi:predicted secreted hydrolase